MKDRIAILLLTTVIVGELSGCTKTLTYADAGPILKERCGECHTGDGEGVKASGFSVDSYETVMKGTRLGPVIVAGSAESSSLYRMVSGKTDPQIQMPHGKTSLSDEQIATLKTWIDQGAAK